MPSLEDLNLVDEETGEVAPDELPRQGGGLLPLPKPGTHRFQLPDDLSSVWETVDTDKGQRVAAVFADEKALRVVDLAQMSFRGRISTVERARGKERKLASDMAYLLVALGDKSGPRKSSDYIKALNGHGGEQFLADVEWQGFCNPQKDIYRSNAEGRSEKVAGQKGCGQRYGQREYENSKGDKTLEIPRNSDGTWAEEFECGTEGCGAIIRAMGQLTNFRAAK